MYFFYYNCGMERLINATLMSFTIDKLELEEQLAKLMSDDNYILKERVKGIKEIVDKLARVENNILKFNSLLVNNNGGEDLETGFETENKN